MGRFERSMRLLCQAAAVVALASALPVAAQPMMGPGGYGWGPGAMMGQNWRGGACTPAAAGLAPWRMSVIEDLVKPTEAQRNQFDALKDASKHAVDTMAGACPKDYPRSASARLEAMEKRLDAMLGAVKTVRPAFDAFYASLTDDQRRRLDSAWSDGWRGHMWRWRQSLQENR